MRADDADGRQNGCAGALILLGLTVGRHAEAIAANFSSGELQSGSVHSGLRDRIWRGAGRLAVLERRLEQRHFRRRRGQVPAAKSSAALLIYGTGLVCILYLLANVSYLSVLPMHGDANGATVMARGIEYATQDRVASAVAETIFGAAGATIMAARS